MIGHQLHYKLILDQNHLPRNGRDVRTERQNNLQGEKKQLTIRKLAVDSSLIVNHILLTYFIVIYNYT